MLLWETKKSRHFMANKAILNNACNERYKWETYLLEDSLWSQSQFDCLAPLEFFLCVLMCSSECPSSVVVISLVINIQTSSRRSNVTNKASHVLLSMSVDWDRRNRLWFCLREHIQIEMCASWGSINWFSFVRKM